MKKQPTGILKTELLNKNPITMTTRKMITDELSSIEIAFKLLPGDADQYGTVENTPAREELQDREDELMQMLNAFPL
jgi:hypothetical protein